MSMPRSVLLPAFLLAVTAPAQSPLTTLFASNNQGGTNATIYFDLTPAAPGVTVSQIDANLHEVGAVGAVEVWIIQGASATTGYGNPGAWTLHCTSPVIGDAAGVPVPILLDPPLVIAGGTTCGVALCGLGLGHRYTNYSSATGLPPQTYSNADLTLDSRGIATSRFGNGTTSRVVNVSVHYAAPAGATVATCARLGQSCGPHGYASLYEWFGYYNGAAEFDLSNTNVSFVPGSGGGYTVVGGGAYNPVGSLGPASPLALADNTVVAVGSLGLQVCDNGFVAFATGNSGSLAASNFNWTSMLNQPARAFYMWHSYNPTLGGTIWYEESGTQAQITFDGVFNSVGTASGPSYFQFQIDVATGACVLAIGAIATDTTAYIVGYSPGGPSAIPGMTDISAALAGGFLELTAGDVLQATLRPTSRPVSGTSWDLRVENIPLGPYLGVTVLGLADPGILDLAAIGAPTCQLRATLDLLDVFVPAGATYAYGVAIPVLTPALVGFELYEQSAILGLTGVNAFGLVSTNGVRGTLALE